MHPLKLTVEGKYWDCQIYRGRLYLFGRDGSLKIVAWDDLVASIPVVEKLRLAVFCGLSQGDYLYGPQWAKFFADEDIKSTLLTKFETLAQFPMSIDGDQLDRYVLHNLSSPFPFPHIDSTIYNNSMYVAAQAGLQAARIGSDLAHGISKKTKKLWDCPVVNLTGAYQSLAIAAGGEGLFEQSLEATGVDPHQLSPSHCSHCSWIYHDVFASSRLSDGFVASFEKSDFGGDVERTFKGIIPAAQLFHTSGYSWGAQDKIYQYNSRKRELLVLRYNPFEDRTNPVTSLGRIHFVPEKGEFVGARVAMFGTLMEFEGAIVVLPSQGAPRTIWGESISWRVYPRSRRYENHLHVIFDDRLEIYSFNHDYFVDQSEKIAGIRRGVGRFEPRYK